MRVRVRACTVGLIGVAVDERQRRGAGVPILRALSLRQLRLRVAQLNAPQDDHYPRTAVHPFDL